jgi:hypothetical protein
MKLGSFSNSLTIKDIRQTKAFNENLGWTDHSNSLNSLWLFKQKQIGFLFIFKMNGQHCDVTGR